MGYTQPLSDTNSLVNGHNGTETILGDQQILDDQQYTSDISPEDLQKSQISQIDQTFRNSR